MKSLYRSADAAINRVSEGLRVLEDLGRFVLQLPPDLLEKLKSIRHRVRKSLPADYLSFFRDVEADPLKGFSDLEAKTSVKNIVISNFKRVEEGLRTLEEFFGSSFKVLRFEIYSIEKAYLKFFPRLGPLYLITQRSLRPDLSDDEYIDFVAGIVKTGYLDVIQVREKGSSFRLKLNLALRVKEICSDSGCTLIVNDDPFMAMEVEAGGVHLGFRDYPVESVRKTYRKFYPFGLIGYSPEDEKDLLRKLPFVDYLGIGDVFGTSTKKDAGAPIGIEGLKERISLSGDIPVYAVGGITPENFQQVLEAGAFGAAFSSCVLKASQPQKVLERFIKILTVLGRA